MGWQVHAGGGHARADSTVKMITHEAALLGPQGHDHPLGCRHLHLLGDAPQRHRGPHLGASSSVRWSSRKGLACSSSSSSGDESFCTCGEHTWNVMMLCSLMRMARLVTLQPVLSGRAFFGACVCCRVSTRVVQTCAVTCHRPSTIYPPKPPTHPGRARGAYASGGRPRPFLQRTQPVRATQIPPPPKMRFQRDRKSVV